MVGWRKTWPHCRIFISLHRVSHSIIRPSNHPRRSNHFSNFSMIVSYCFFIFPNHWLHSVPFHWGWLKEFTTIIQKIQCVLISLLRHKKKKNLYHEPLIDIFQNSLNSILWTLIRHWFRIYHLNHTHFPSIKRICRIPRDPTGGRSAGHSHMRPGGPTTAFQTWG